MPGDEPITHDATAKVKGELLLGQELFLSLSELERAMGVARVELVERAVAMYVSLMTARPGTRISWTGTTGQPHELRVVE